MKGPKFFHLRFSFIYNKTLFDIHFLCSELYECNDTILVLTCLIDMHMPGYMYHNIYIIFSGTFSIFSTHNTHFVITKYMISPRNE